MTSIMPVLLGSPTEVKAGNFSGNRFHVSIPADPAHITVTGSPGVDIDLKVYDESSDMNRNRFIFVDTDSHIAKFGQGVQGHFIVEVVCNRGSCEGYDITGSHKDSWSDQQHNAHTYEDNNSTWIDDQYGCVIMYENGRYLEPCYP